MAGELGLNGEVKGIRGVLSIIDTAKRTDAVYVSYPKRIFLRLSAGERLRSWESAALKNFWSMPERMNGERRRFLIINGNRIRQNIRRISLRSLAGGG